MGNNDYTSRVVYKLCPNDCTISYSRNFRSRNGNKCPILIDSKPIFARMVSKTN